MLCKYVNYITTFSSNVSLVRLLPNPPIRGPIHPPPFVCNLAKLLSLSLYMILFLISFVMLLPNSVCSRSPTQQATYIDVNISDFQKTFESLQLAWCYLLCVPFYGDRLKPPQQAYYPSVSRNISGGWKRPLILPLFGFP